MRKSSLCTLPFLGFFLGLTFCQAELEDGGTDEDAQSDAEPHAVYYELSWDGGHDDKEPSVEIVDGSLNTESMQLVPCVASLTSVTWQTPLSFGLARAWAGHGEGEADASAVETPQVESLASFGSVEFGAAMASLDYCAAYWQVGPDEDGVTMSLDVVVDGVTRTLLSSARYSRQAELDETIEMGSYATLVVFERKLASMFDGVDWSASDAEAADRVLRNLVADAETLIFTD